MSQQQSFNTLTEPWIPVLKDDMSIVEVSLGDAVLNAHLYKFVAAENPIVNASLYRLLVTFLSRACNINSKNRLLELWKQKQICSQDIDKYIFKWKNRFDVFDPDVPFFQNVSSAEEVKFFVKKNVHPVHRLFFVGETSRTYFVHVSDADASNRQYDHARIVRLLISSQQYAISAGRGYRKSLSFTSGGIYLLEGKNLLETLLLNSAAATSRNNSDDKPCWEEDVGYFRSSKSVPSGFYSTLTWLVVRQKLLPNWQYLKRDKNGRKIDYTHIDPFSIVLPGSNKKPVTLKCNTGNFWKDFHSFLSQHETSRGNNNTGLMALRQLPFDILNERKPSIACFGMDASNSEIKSWREDHYSMPLSIVDKELSSDLESLVGVAAKAERAMYSVFLSTCKNSSSRKSMIKRYIEKTNEAFYWTPLEDEFWGNVRIIEEKARNGSEDEIEDLIKTTKERWRKLVLGLIESCIAKVAASRNIDPKLYFMTDGILHQFRKKIKNV